MIRFKVYSEFETIRIRSAHLIVQLVDRQDRDVEKNYIFFHN